MKLYYDSDGGPTWVEVTAIVGYPTVKEVMNNPSTCVVSLRDFEGALYATWYSRNFTAMKITDDAANTIFRGYLINKQYRARDLVLTLIGFGALLDWKRFHNSYILADGVVKTVPYAGLDVDDQTSGNAYPNIDAGTNDWHATAGNHWDNVNLDDPLTDNCIYADDTDDGQVEEIGVGALTVTSCEKVTVYVYTRDDDSLGDGEIDLDMGGYQGAKTLTFTQGEWGWDSYEWTGDWSQADVGGAQCKFTAPAVIGAGKMVKIACFYLVFNHTTSSLKAIELETDDEGTFGWDADHWINDRDVGLMIVDNTSGNVPITYTPSAIAPANHDNVLAGNNASTTTANDGNVYWVQDRTPTGAFDTVVTSTVDGANIADTNDLQSIEILYKFGARACGQTGILDYAQCTVKLQISNDGTWEDVAQVSAGPTHYVWYYDVGPNYIEGSFLIEGTNAEIADYLDKTGANYDAVKGLRFVLTGNTSSGVGAVSTTYPFGGNILIDYIGAIINYHATDISPIMVKIHNSGDEWVVNTDTTWTDSGAAATDKFYIGENTTKILSEVFGTAGIPYVLSTTLSKYIARDFRGSHCIDALQAVCMLEGLHWFEDHENYLIKVSHPDDFEDSGVDLTQADYDWEWEYEDACNHVRRVDVWGNASYNIHEFAIDSSSDSLSDHQIIDESIMTSPDAKEVATTQLALLKDKAPSIKMVLQGTQTDLKVGKTVGITMVRPTVAEDDYAIRMIERSRVGVSSIVTIIHAGLGHTEADEVIGQTIKMIGKMAHKAHTDRLISTPWTGGASITWDDIGGKPTVGDMSDLIDDTTPQLGGDLDCQDKALTAIKSLVFQDGGATVDIVRDEDTLSSDDANALATQQSIKAYIDGLLHIGSANSGWINCTLEGSNLMASAMGMWLYAFNTGASDYNLTYNVPLPPMIGALKLYIASAEVGVKNADAVDDYVDAFILYTWDAGSATAYTANVNDGTNRTASGIYSYAFADVDCSAVEKTQATLDIKAGGAPQMQVSFVKVEYYYAA